MKHANTASMITKAVHNESTDPVSLYSPPDPSDGLYQPVAPQEMGATPIVQVRRKTLYVDNRDRSKLMTGWPRLMTTPSLIGNRQKDEEPLMWSFPFTTKFSSLNLLHLFLSFRFTNYNFNLISHMIILKSQSPYFNKVLTYFNMYTSVDQQDTHYSI